MARKYCPECKSPVGHGYDLMGVPGTDNMRECRFLVCTNEDVCTWEGAPVPFGPIIPPMMDEGDYIAAGLR